MSMKGMLQRCWDHDYCEPCFYMLLDHPLKYQTQTSRSISRSELDEMKEKILHAAEHGAVPVSPCISPGEKEISRAVMDAGHPLIVVLDNGLRPHYKPPGRYFDACAAGNLLMVAPLPNERRKHRITRRQCLMLNDWAAAIADVSKPDKLDQ